MMPGIADAFSAAGRDVPRRVALLSYHTSPLAPLGGSEAGGMNVYIREVARELGAMGVEVDVFTRRASRDAAPVQAIAPGARLLQIDAGPPERLEKAELAEHITAFAQQVTAHAACEGTAYEVVHSHYWMSTLAGEVLAAEWRAPHLAMFHTLGRVKLRARASEREPQERLDAEGRLVHTVDHIVAATEHERRLLRQIYRVAPQRVETIPLGVDLERFRPRARAGARQRLGLAEDDRVILAVGRIQPLKGLDVLIHAIGAMTERDRVRLLIAGGDDRASAEIERLREVARLAGVGEHVCFVGPVPHEDLPSYYNAADVVAVPSFYESFGLVAIEAMASGVPVVASRVGGLVSTVGDGRSGYLIPWRCPEPFAEKLELLLRNEALRRALGAAGVERMQAYSWRAVAERLCALYEDAIARAHAGAAVVGGGL